MSAMELTDRNIQTHVIKKKKYIYKQLVVLLFILFTWPLSLLSVVTYRVFGTERIYAMFAQFVSLFPGIFGQYVRTSFYRLTLEECYSDLAMGFCSFVSHPTARIGRSVVVSAFSIIGTATIEENVLISARVSILSGKYQHEMSQPGEVSYRRVTIGRSAWIGENAVVMCNIGANCIVAAGAVVTKDMPEGMIGIGNPARFLKQGVMTSTKEDVHG